MSVTRRAFIGRAGVVLGGAPLAGLLAGCAAATALRVRPENGVLRVDLASVPDLQPGGSGVAAIQAADDGEHLFIVRQPSGSFVTVSSTCTHRGCTVEAKTDRFVCPCHGSTYSLAGDVLKGPAELALRKYGTVVQGTALIIDYRRQT